MFILVLQMVQFLLPIDHRAEVCFLPLVLVVFILVAQPLLALLLLLI
nr:MAG TPA: hypothetical protein [Caudoviricetes sp.]